MEPIQTSQLEPDSQIHKLKKKDYNLLRLMQCNDKSNNKIRKINKQE